MHAGAHNPRRARVVSPGMCLVLWAQLALSCSDDPDPPAAMTGMDGGGTDRDAATDAGDAHQRPDCEAVMQDVLLTCGGIVCHDPFSGGIGTVLDLSNRDVLPGSLIGLSSSVECGNVPYVNVDQPEQSLLILKLQDEPPCGNRMPDGARPPLTETQRGCFVEWVNDAAARARLLPQGDSGL